MAAILLVLVVAGLALSAVSSSARAEPVEEPVAALTAAFLADTIPAAHGGKQFVVRIQFTAPVTTSFAVLRDQVLQATNGDRLRFRRVKGRSDVWEIHIKPHSAEADVTLALPASASCSDAASVCTADLQPLSEPVTLNVPALSVEAAQSGEPVEAVAEQPDDNAADPVVTEPAPAPDCEVGEAGVLYRLSRNWKPAPSGLAAVVLDDGVALCWRAPLSDAETVTGYRILRRRPHEGEQTLAVLVADSGSTAAFFTDATANEPGVRYVYRVKALRGAELSEWSNSASARRPGLDGPEYAPSSLSASMVLGDGVEPRVWLRWAAPAWAADDVTGYRIERALGDDAFSVLVRDTQSSRTSYIDADASDMSVSYRYRVRALRGGRVSDASSEYATLTSGGTPTLLNAERQQTATPGTWSSAHPALSVTGITSTGAVIVVNAGHGVANNSDLRGYTLAISHGDTGYGTSLPGRYFTLPNQLSPSGARCTRVAACTETVPRSSPIREWRIPTSVWQLEPQTTYTFDVNRITVSKKRSLLVGLVNFDRDDIGQVTFTTNRPSIGDAIVDRIGWDSARVTVPVDNVGALELSLNLGYHPSGATDSEELSAPVRGGVAVFELRGLEQRTSYDLVVHLPAQGNLPDSFRNLGNAFTTRYTPPSDPVVLDTTVTVACGVGCRQIGAWHQHEHSNPAFGSIGQRAFTVSGVEYLFQSVFNVGSVGQISLAASTGNPASPYVDAPLPFDFEFVLNGASYSNLKDVRIDIEHGIYSWDAFSLRENEVVSVRLIAAIADICDRTPAIRDLLLSLTPADDRCSAVFAHELAAITTLDLSGRGLRSFAPGDLDGLTGLLKLDLSENQLDPELPAEIFSDLGNLTELDLRGYSERRNPRSRIGQSCSIAPHGPGDGTSHWGRYPWNPRNGSPFAFAPLTSLVTLHWDPDAADAADNYNQPPAPPENLRVSESNGALGRRFAIEWDAPSAQTGITGYRIERIVNGTGAHNTLTCGGGRYWHRHFDALGGYVGQTAGATSFTDAGLEVITSHDGRFRGRVFGWDEVRSLQYLVYTLTAEGPSLPAIVQAR